MKVTAYSFNPATRVFAGAAELGQGDMSPRQPGVYLVPANCVLHAPGEIAPGKLAVLSADAAEWLIEDVPGLPELTAEERLKQLQGAVQQALDDRARLYGYDGVLSAISYSEEPAVPKFQREGLAFRAWRSEVWAACYLILAEVKAERRAEPSVDALLQELPAFELAAEPVAPETAE